MQTQEYITWHFFIETNTRFIFFFNILQVGSTRESISMSLSIYSNSPSVKLYIELYVHLGGWQYLFDLTWTFAINYTRFVQLLH